MLSKMPEYNVQVPFKPMHIVEYMRNYLKEHRDQITPLDRKIAYQRPCASRYTGEMDPVLDEAFELLGVERVARKYDRESALCCGSLFSRIDPERIKPTMAKNIQDALGAGAEAMVFLCPVCMRALAKPALEQGLKPVFITQLARMALGERPVF
jgi:Fe-S oxidoreductase